MLDGYTAYSFIKSDQSWWGPAFTQPILLLLPHTPPKHIFINQPPGFESQLSPVPLVVVAVSFKVPTGNVVVPVTGVFILLAVRNGVWLSFKNIDPLGSEPNVNPYVPASSISIWYVTVCNSSGRVHCSGLTHTPYFCASPDHASTAYVIGFDFASFVFSTVVPSSL